MRDGERETEREEERGGYRTERERATRNARVRGGGRRWCSRKAIGGGDGSVEQKGCGGCGRGRTPMEENGGVAAAG